MSIIIVVASLLKGVYHHDPYMIIIRSGIMRDVMGSVSPDDMADAFRKKARENHHIGQLAFANEKYQAAANRYYYALIQAIRAKLEEQSLTVEKVCPDKYERFTEVRVRSIDWSKHEAIVTPQAMFAANLPEKFHCIVWQAQRHRITSDYAPYGVTKSQIKIIDEQCAAILKALE